MAIDEKLFLWINGLAGRVELADRVMSWIVSDYLVPVTLALLLVGMWFVGDKETRQRNQLGMFVALTSMGLSSLAVFTINAFYFRPRPFIEHEVVMLFYRPTDSSFPANSVAAAFGLAATVWGMNRKVGAVALLWAGLWGFSRVYAGVHYPLDVLAGAAIGVTITFFVFRLRDLLRPILLRVVRAARIFVLA